MNVVCNKFWRIYIAPTYLAGSSDFSVRTDMRGVRTVTRSAAHADRDVTETQTFSPTNPVNPEILSRNTYYRNGASESYREWGDQWTRDTRLTRYDTSGCRIESHVAEASDQAAVTNSVTTYDFLGRTVATVTPLGVTSNFYDSASMRILTTTRTGQPPVQILYNTLGEQVGSVVSGITNRTDVSYETVSGEVWRVTSSLSG